MRPHEIIKHTRKQPFKAFRVCITDGTSYDVRHPELILVTRTEIAIAIGVNGGIPDEMVYCDPMHVTCIEPLPPASPRRSES
jgi:hypothetical protein